MDVLDLIFLMLSDTKLNIDIQEFFARFFIHYFRGPNVFVTPE